MQDAIMILKMFSTFETFQIGVSLSGVYAIMSGKLANECHCIANIVLLFTCHIISFMSSIPPFYPTELMITRLVS